MGTWGTDIKENDTSGEVYDEFFSLYNDGQKPKDITALLIKNNTALIADPGDANNFWLALALAQWEIKALNEEVFKKVKNIIESGNDLEIWRKLDADEADILERKQHLDKFLAQITTQKKHAKPRVKEEDEIPLQPVFTAGDCIAFKLDNGNYSGLVVLGTNKNRGLGSDLVAATRINQPVKPVIQDFEKAEILIRNYANWKDDRVIVWLHPDSYRQFFSDVYEYIGKLSMDKDYTNAEFDFTGDWEYPKVAANTQFQHELHNPKPKIKVTVSKMIKNKRWWRFW